MHLQLNLMVVVSVVLTALMLLLPNGRADVPWLGPTEVVNPAATESDGQNLIEGHPEYAQDQNQVGTSMWGLAGGQMVMTSNFTGGYVAPYNAVIQKVYIMAIVKNTWTNYHNPYPRTCKLGWGQGDNRTEPPDLFTLNSPTYTVNGDYWRELDFEITHDLDKNWTANELTGNSTDVLWLVLYSSDVGTEVNKLQVDYLGLRYNYTVVGSGTENESSTPNAWVDLGWPDITGIFGLIGFIGMIAVPPAALWFYQREGGNAIAAGVAALISEMICFTLFLGSIA